MKKSVLLIGLSVLLILAFALSACQPAATPAATEPPMVEPTAEQVGGFQIPAVQEGKFNVAMVLIGPHDDGGWSQAHYEGLLDVAKNIDNVNVAYVENVPEGADSEQVFRALSLLRLHGPHGDRRR
jgi:basic membrane lipoprotein Med (substrate-binding protein (PBP1-ABC) superfamily)